MTITPPRGTSGTARTVSRNRRRRPQVPGEPRHAANAPAFEEAPAPRRRARPERHSGEGPGGWFPDDVDDVRAEPDPSFPAPPDGLGARLYEVMSDTEREAAVAETLLFVRPDFSGGPPPAQPAPAFTAPPPAHAAPDFTTPPTLPPPPVASSFTAPPALSPPSPGTVTPEPPPDPAPAAETILFTRPADWEPATGRYLTGRSADTPARTHAGGRDVSPMTETFLFGPAVRHAQEPRSPIDGAAETLLFAGLARALATRPDVGGTDPDRSGQAQVDVADENMAGWPAAEAWTAQAGAVMWDMPSRAVAPDRATASPPVTDPAAPGLPVDWAVDNTSRAGAGPAYRESVEIGHRIAGGGRRAWEALDRDAARPEASGDAGVEDARKARRGRRTRERNPFPEQSGMGAAGLDRPGRVVNRKRFRAAEIDRDAPGEDSHSPERLSEDVRELIQDWTPENPQPTATLTPENPQPAAAWTSEDAQPATGWDVTADPIPDESPEPGLEPGLSGDGPLGLGADGSRELSPERIAKVAAAEAAWRAFAEGDREPGTEIRTGRRAKSRWLTSLTGAGAESKAEAETDAAPKRRHVLWPVILRCLLYLGPLSVAATGAGALGRVAWPVPAATLLLGWAAAQALTSVGVTVARRAGPEAAVRLIGAGFAAVTALWCALVWISPPALLGPDRLLAASVGAGGLATLATVTAALVTRSEGAVIRWYLPCWLLAGASLAAAGGAAGARYVPVETLLPAAIVAVLVRAFRPAVLFGRECRIPRLTAVERRRGLAYLVIGLAQATCVALLWQAGPAVTPTPAALPLLLAVPMLEALIGWHTARIEAGLDSAQTFAELDRHVRNVTMITLAGLVPPLAAGGALALASYRLPHGLAALGGTQTAVLALAAGTLLGGVFAITFLLAARSRTGIAATLAAAPPLATLALPLLPRPDAGPLPLAVAVLAATHVAGLLIVALTAADLRRTP